MHGRQRSSSIVADREASREKQYNTLVVVDDDCVAAIFLHSASLRSCGLQFGCDTISSGIARKKIYLCTSSSCVLSFPHASGAGCVRHWAQRSAQVRFAGRDGEERPHLFLPPPRRRITSQPENARTSARVRRRSASSDSATLHT